MEKGAMNQERKERLSREYEAIKGRLKKPAELLLRGVTKDDFVDSAIIGGVAIADIIAGKISEHQIPDGVLHAFHLQYPNETDFVSTVQHHAGDSEALSGLINGIKGKLFEDRYVEWLNDGHLPDGFHASLAHAANNPAWDIAITDSHGHVADVLQAKATASMDYVHAALAAHPDIDVVVTSEVFDAMSAHGDDLSHVIDSHQHLGDLTSHVDGAVDHAETAGGAAFHMPWIAIGWAIAQNVSRYRKGSITFEQALKDASRRTGLAVGAGAAGFVVADAVAPGVGVATAVLVRLYGKRIFGNLDLREVANRSITITQEAARQLQKQLPRQVELKLLPPAPLAVAAAGQS